jgi:predicted HTH transcriptional regulator
MLEQLLSRLTAAEDAFVERKLESTNDREIRKELVAFANSVPDNANAVLFLGVADNGKTIGVSNTDEKQKKVRKIAEQDCYPPISVQMYVIPIKNQSVLAVVIPASRDKPHFSGQAFVRVGSESKAASKAQYEYLINSRNDVCHEILCNKNSIFSVRVINKKLGIHKSDNRRMALT